MPRAIARALALLLVATASLTGLASVALADMPAPAQTWVTDGTVARVAPGASGVVYITGDFSEVAPATGSFGSFDATTGAQEAGWPDVVGTIYAIASDGSGGWYIGGSLSSVGGLPRVNLAHILADESVDTAWAPSAAGVVYSLAVAGSSVYIGGDFGQVDGHARSELAAVDSSTGALQAFDPEVTGAPDSGSAVRALAAVGTTLYTGGLFAAVGADTRSDLAAIDTTTGLATSFAPDPDSRVDAFALDGSTLYVGGSFGTIAGASRGAVAAFDTTSGALTTWAPVQTEFGTNRGNISALAVSGSTVYLGGAFQAVGGLPRSGLAAVNTTDGAPTAWAPIVAQTCDFSNVESLAVTASTVYAGDACSGAALGPKTDLVAFDRTTAAKTTFTVDINALPYALAVSGSQIVAGGDFTSAGPWTARNGLAAIDTATGAATTWNPALTGSPLALAVSGSKVYVAHSSFVSFATHTSIAVVDTTTGSATDLGPDVVGQVLSLAVADGSIYIGGKFSSVSGQPRANLASATLATGAVRAWNPGTGSSGSDDGTVRTLVTAGSTVYVEGGFVSVGGQPRGGIAAIDEASGTTTSWNPDLTRLGSPVDPSSMSALAVSSTTVYVAGSFDTADGQPRVDVASFDLQTNEITPWSPTVQLGSSLFLATALLVGNGVVYLSGGDDVTQIGTLTAYDATTGAPTGWQIQVSPSANNAEPVAEISTFALDGGAIYVAGAFTHMNGQNVSSYARFAIAGTTTTATAPADATAPTIAGSATVGASLSCSTGSWSGDPVPTFGFQWLRDGAPIGGEVAIAHGVTGDDAGHTLACRVTASNSAGSAAASSAAVSVPAIVVTPPAQTTPPASTPTPTPTPTAPVAHLPSGTVPQVKAAVAIVAKTLAASGALQLKVTCPATATSACTGTFNLATAKAIKAAKGAKPKVVVLGHATFHVAAGKSGKAQITLSKPSRQLLARLRSLSVRLTTTTRAAGVSAASVATTAFTLHAHG